MRSATHSEASAMCLAYAGSVLTLGMLANAISSSRISLALSPEIVSKWWISVAVNAFRETFGRAALSSRRERG